MVGQYQPFMQNIIQILGDPGGLVQPVYAGFEIDQDIVHVGIESLFLTVVHFFAKFTKKTLLLCGQTYDETLGLKIPSLSSIFIAY